MDLKTPANSSPIITVLIQSSTFDVAAETQLLESALEDRRVNMGALTSFIGSVRASETGLSGSDDAAAYGELLALDIEHYPAIDTIDY